MPTTVSSTHTTAVSVVGIPFQCTKLTFVYLCTQKRLESCVVYSLHFLHFLNINNNEELVLKQEFKMQYNISMLSEGKKIKLNLKPILPFLNALYEHCFDIIVVSENGSDINKCLTVSLPPSCLSQHLFGFMLECFEFHWPISWNQLLE